MKKLQAWRSGSRVRRFHTVFTHMPDYVGLHSGGVAWLCYMVNGEGISPALLLAALSHDLPEAVTGDVPSPTKKAMGGALDAMESVFFDNHDLPNFVEGLSPRDRQVLAYCDAADGLLFCLDELERGNREVVDIAARYMGYLRTYEIDGARWNSLHWSITKYFTEVVGER